MSKLGHSKALGNFKMSISRKSSWRIRILVVWEI